MINASDLHLRWDIPISRRDDYLSAQSRKFQFILKLASESPPLIVSGDFSDKAKPPYDLLYWIMSEIDKAGNPDILVVPGQHDMLWHTLKFIDNKTCLGILNKSNFITMLIDQTKPYIFNDLVIWPCPYGTQPIRQERMKNKINILVWHNMVINKGEELWQEQKALVSGKLLRQYKEYDLILTGDNHCHFIESYNGRFLLNSGSMMRMKTNQKDHKPCVFRWDKGNLEQIFLPIEEDVFDDSHIVEKEEKENRLDGFITKLNEIRPELNENSSVSFKGNLKNFFQTNKDMRNVEEITWQCVPKDRK